MRDWSASAGNMVTEQGLTVEDGCRASASKSLARAYNTLIIERGEEEPSAIPMKQQKEPQDSYGSRDESHGEDISNT